MFHTFATTWARVLDVVPILVFQLVFLWLYGRRIVDIKPAYVALLLAVFLSAALYGRQFSQMLGGSLTYAPALLVLFPLGAYHYKHQKVEPRLILVAAGVFLASLSFRSVDNAICGVLPVGTHFLWHTLNAVLLYLLARAYLLNLPTDRRAT